jgi:hypothetical protein
MEVLYTIETSPEINRPLRGELVSHWMAQMAHRKLSIVILFNLAFFEVQVTRR